MADDVGATAVVAAAPYAPYLIIAASLSAALVVELLCWLLVARTSTFKALASEVASLRARMVAHVDAGKSKEDRKYKSLDLSMAKCASQMFLPKVKIGFINFLVLGVLWRVVTSWYGGVVVAKLPGTPLAMLTGITHRGLPGTDMTDCSSHAIYALSQMLVKGVIAKFCNRELHRALQAGASGNTMLEAMKQAKMA